eukprot:3459772-Pleurochrysis_carterae.AAC.1
MLTHRSRASFLSLPPLFYVRSPRDLRVAVAKTAGHMTEGRHNGVPMRIAGLARAHKKDLERCYNAVKHAPLHRIHTFLASSDIHLEHKLGISRQKCIEISSSMVAFAKTMVDDIEFSPEDAGRSDPAFLAELCRARRHLTPPFTRPNAQAVLGKRDVFGKSEQHTLKVPGRWQWR